MAKMYTICVLFIFNMVVYTGNNYYNNLKLMLISSTYTSLRDSHSVKKNQVIFLFL